MPSRQAYERSARHLLTSYGPAFGFAGWALVGSLVAPDRPGPLTTWPMLACLAAFVVGAASGRSTRPAQRFLPPLILLAAALVLATSSGSGLPPVHPNDLAALFALLLPWWLVPPVKASVTASVTASGTATGSGRLARCLAFAAAAACAYGLWRTGSRGAILAVGAGLVATVAVALPYRRLGQALRASGTRCRWVVLLFAVSVAAVASTFVPSLADASRADTSPPEGAVATARDWLRDHDAEGFSWRNLASGRPAIWRQATHVGRDFPLFGVGPGGFGRLVPKVYPLPVERLDLLGRRGPPAIDDAHSLYLETAAALGLPALAAYLALALLALVRLAHATRGPDATVASTWALGAFGGLLAFLVHGLGDCPAPGSAVYAVSWLALGHALASRRDESDEPDEPPRPVSLQSSVVALVVILAAVAALVLALWPAENRHREALAVVLSGEPDDVLADRLPYCADAWWRDRLERSASTAAEVAHCAPERLVDLRSSTPLDASRARAAYDERPDHPDAIRWHIWNLPADAMPRSEFLRGTLRYLALRPRDAEARMEFLARAGAEWDARRPHARLAFLAHACVHGDPGANACLGAGLLARRLDLGDPVADAFFLASEWPGARRLAD